MVLGGQVPVGVFKNLDKGTSEPSRPRGVFMDSILKLHDGARPIFGKIMLR